MNGTATYLKKSKTLAALLIAWTAAAQAPAAAQNGAPGTNWRYWGGDSGSTRYSPLDQINADNAANLEVVWRWKADNFGPRPEFNYKTTPLAVNGILYAAAGYRRAVVAIDGATGETLWMWRMKPNPRWETSPRQFSGRGVAYAEVDGKGRIFVITPGFYMAALDAETGREIEEFGTQGIVDLQVGLGYDVDPVTGIAPENGVITSGSPPIVVGDIVVVNNASDRGYYPPFKENIPGHIRGYNVRSGEQEWIFHVVPKPGEFGNETWENDSWTYSGNANSWAPLSADLELGIVYIPTDTPTGDYYGGHRLGDNLYGTSLIALRASTGEKIWHQQFVRHDIWNFDNPTAPNLVDVTVDGRRIKAIVQTTKQGWAYAFDRVTGEPIWPFEERAVPDTDVPGERVAPTQRFPTRPAAYEMQGTTIDNLIDFTPELRAEAIEIASNYRMGPIFTPPSLAEHPDGTKGAFVMPGANGGTNIPGGAAVDPETGILYVASERGHSVISMVNAPERSSMDFISLGPGGIRGPQGLELFKPPYGHIIAIDMNTGEHIFDIPNGDTPESTKNHPALAGVDLPRTGKRSHATVLVTKTLLFAGEGTRGEAIFRAHDKRTGEIIAEIEIPGPTNAAPMSYEADGRQFIVVAVAGAGHPAELVALALEE